MKVLLVCIVAITGFCVGAAIAYTEHLDGSVTVSVAEQRAILGKYDAMQDELRALKQKMGCI